MWRVLLTASNRCRLQKAKLELDMIERLATAARPWTVPGKRRQRQRYNPRFALTRGPVDVCPPFGPFED